MDGPSSEAVLTTPLFPCVLDDALHWKSERNGNYTVRSAYRLTENTTHNHNSNRVDGNRDTIWKLKVPPKVRNFLWRLGRNCIPTRDVLISRGLEVPSLCPFCGEFEETNLHLFADCITASAVWSALSVPQLLAHEAATTDSFHSWFFSVLQQLQGDLRVVWAMNMWSIWSSRNNLI